MDKGKEKIPAQERLEKKEINLEDKENLKKYYLEGFLEMLDFVESIDYKKEGYAANEVEEVKELARKLVYQNFKKDLRVQGAVEPEKAVASLGYLKSKARERVAKDVGVKNKKDASGEVSSAKKDDVGDKSKIEKGEKDEFDVESLDSVTGFLRKAELSSKEFYMKSLDNVIEKLSKEGAIVELKEGVPTLMISDFHARGDFLANVLEHKMDSGKTVFDLLGKGEINVVCMGDGMHSEERENWAAYRFHYNLDEFSQKFPKLKDDIEKYKKFLESLLGGEDKKLYKDLEFHSIRKAVEEEDGAVEEYLKKNNLTEKVVMSMMDAEMARGLSLMKVVMELKTRFPENFHYVRGNHDDLGETMIRFKKYSNESGWTRYWAQEFGEDFYDKYLEFESKMPLLAEADDFIVSHAAPKEELTRKGVEKRDKNAFVSLTCTENNRESYKESNVVESLGSLGKSKDSRWFIGHRRVDHGEKFREQFDGRLIQINHKENQLVAIVGKDGIDEFDLNRDVIDLTE
ncbi:hypothetical protein ACFL2R_01540 [Patescibacteria group bacterium]